MKLISIEDGRSIQIFVPDEITPKAGLYYPEMIERIASKYSFVEAPDPRNLSKGAKFSWGRLTLNAESINIKELTIFNDGIACSAASTQEADIVLNELMPWMTSEFSFRTPTTIIPRHFSSSVVVEFDASINKFVHAFKKISELMGKSWSSTYSSNKKFDLQHIMFSEDRTQRKMVVEGPIDSDFSIERRMKMSNGANRCYCVAPISTESHISLLEDIEREFMSA